MDGFAQAQKGKMMNDLISRQALLEEYDRVHIGPPGKARELIEDAPTIEERKTGVWLDDEDDPESVKTDGYCAYCSACKEWSEYLTAYCGSCGADMRGTWKT